MKIQIKNSRTISAVGFLILIVVIWVVGPLLGLSIENCLKLISGVMVLWVLTLLVGQVVAMRAGRLLEKMFRSQADDAVRAASAARRAEVNLLRESLLSAIGKLKASKLLYELPWYMIIGHSAAGKSTALLQSGLTFPFSEQGGSVQGIGGTRNCDWFFSTEGVLLDTAGRYATQTEDRGEWLEFLRMLKRYRSKAPVNGILVATSLPELMQHQSDSFSAYARQIRERIHEVEDTFGLRMPIYLIFTKLDLLGGFSQFFEDLDEAGHDRVWGATLPHEQNADFNARLEVDRQFELLYRGLRQIGEAKLGLSRGIGGKPALFAFPLEFHALKDSVAQLVELLHEDDPYHVKPLLRGFYFTSALQSGEPQIAAAMRVSRQFKLERSSFRAVQPSASRGYFLRDMFREVLFPDQYLIQRQTRPGVSRLRLGAMAAGMGALGVGVALLTQSWLGNGSMLRAIGASQAQATGLMSREPLADKLKGLSILQKHLEELQSHRVNGVPWKIGLGLYQGGKLEAALRKRYFGELSAVMLEPVRGNLENALKQRGQKAPLADEAVQTSGSPLPQSDDARQAGEESYNTLKTYLMLAQKPKMEADWLSRQLPLFWQPWLEARQVPSESVTNGDAGNAVKFYLSQIKAPDLPLIKNDVSLVDLSRKNLLQALDRQPAGERVYAELKNRANAKFPSLTVSRILNGRDAAIMSGTVEVPGAFTREAWDKYMKRAIVEVSQGGIESEDWVLSVSSQEEILAQSGDFAKNQSELETLYRADYAKAWITFLKGVVVGGLSDYTQAGSTLTRLADHQNSPIRAVLQRAAYETAWDNPSLVTNTVKDARQNIMEKTAGVLQGGNALAPDARLDRADERYGALGRQFAALASLVGDGKQIPASMAGYLERLGKLKARFGKIMAADEPSLGARDLMEDTLNGTNSELVDAMRHIDEAMISANEAQFQDMLRPLLAMPLLKSYAILLPPVEEDLNLLWENEVYEAWQELAGRYPFSNSRDEAEFSEIASFVKSGGVLDAFVAESLGDLVTRRGNQIIPRQWHGKGVRLDAAFLANTERLLSFSATLKRGGETARFELQPVPTPGLSEIRIEIDGQTLRYRNGPQPWQAFRWPVSENQGARIQAVAFNGTTATVSEQPGRMGLIRMLGQGARAYDPNATRGQLTWRIEGLGGAEAVKVNFNMVSGLNPMQLSALKSISLPRRITQ